MEMDSSVVNSSNICGEEDDNSHSRSTIKPNYAEDSSCVYSNHTTMLEENNAPTSSDFSSLILAIDFKDEFQSKGNNFTKGCKWSPDGLCLLVASEDKHVRIFNLPHPIVNGAFQNESWFTKDWKAYNKAAINVQEGELIYDYCWYPGMKSDDRQTCCFATTCRDLPIHLWDAWTGELICGYSYYNHLDQLTAAHSVNFSTDGGTILAGFNKKVCVFQTARPGRQFITYDNKDHTGIISCLAAHPKLPNIFAAGSYNGSIGLYTHNYKKHFLRLSGHNGGTTHIAFTKDGSKLFSGARMDNTILCWDIRNPGAVLHSFSRIVNNNQRIYFDLNSNDTTLVSGSTSSKVYFWNIEESIEHEVLPKSSFSPHNDCVNGVSFHPEHPILATSSGQRHLPDLDIDCDSDQENYAKLTSRNIKCESSVKLWYFGSK